MTDQQPAEGTSVGSTLRELRRERGWTLRRLRQETGISIPYLSMIERDDVSRPSREKLEVIAEALGADPGEVLREHDKADLVNRLGFDPVLAEFVLRLREATPEERDQLLEGVEEVMSRLEDKELRPSADPEIAPAPPTR